MPPYLFFSVFLGCRVVRHSTLPKLLLVAWCHLGVWLPQGLPKPLRVLASAPFLTLRYPPSVRPVLFVGGRESACFKYGRRPRGVASSGAPKKSDRPPRTPPVIFLREESEEKKNKVFPPLRCDDDRSRGEHVRRVEYGGGGDRRRPPSVARTSAVATVSSTCDTPPSTPLVLTHERFLPLSGTHLFVRASSSPLAAARPFPDRSARSPFRNDPERVPPPHR